MGRTTSGNGKPHDFLTFMALLDQGLPFKINYITLEALFELFKKSLAKNASASKPAVGKACRHWPQDTLGKGGNPVINGQNPPHIPRGPNTERGQWTYTSERSPNRTGSPILL